MKIGEKSRTRIVCEVKNWLAISWRMVGLNLLTAAKHNAAVAVYYERLGKQLKNPH